MAKNQPTWDWQRKWAVKDRAQYLNPRTRLYVKKDMTTWRFLGNKDDWTKFKWVTDKSKK